MKQDNFSSYLAGVIMKQDNFSSYHPIINFVYFVLVIGYSMFIMHPVCRYFLYQRQSILYLTIRDLL